MNIPTLQRVCKCFASTEWLDLLGLLMQKQSSAPGYDKHDFLIGSLQLAFLSRGEAEGDKKTGEFNNARKKPWERALKPSWIGLGREPQRSKESSPFYLSLPDPVWKG